MTAQEALRRIVEAEESRRERRARAEQDAARAAQAGAGSFGRTPPLRWEPVLSKPTTAS